MRIIAIDYLNIASTPQRCCRVDAKYNIIYETVVELFSFIVVDRQRNSFLSTF